MHHRVARTRFLILVLLILGSGAAAAEASSATFRLTLLGSAAVPRGDKGDRAEAVLTFDSRKGRVCWQFSKLTGLGSPTHAHVGKAAKGRLGPSVVSFGRTFTSAGCTNVAGKAIAAILKHPSSYYLTIDNPLHPKGAVRSQL